MMKNLSPTELKIAECYCRGMIDKEVAEEVGKPIWTVRTHKKRIYGKLGVSSTHELVLWMVCRFVGSQWDAGEVRRRGLSAILMIALLFQQLPACEEARRAGTQRVFAETRSTIVFSRRQESSSW